MISIVNECTKIKSLKIGDKRSHDIFEDPLPPLLTSKWVLHAVEKLGSQLEELGMSFIDIDRELIVEMAENCSKLKFLSLRDCFSDDPYLDELSELFETIGQSLEVLDLKGFNYLTGEHFDILRKYLRSSTLKELRVSDLEITVPLKYLVDLIKDCGRGLKKIDIHGSYKNDESPLPLLDTIWEGCNEQVLQKLIYTYPRYGIDLFIRRKVSRIMNSFSQLRTEEVIPGLSSVDAETGI